MSKNYPVAHVPVTGSHLIQSVNAATLLTKHIHKADSKRSHYRIHVG